MKLLKGQIFFRFRKDNGWGVVTIGGNAATGVFEHDVEDGDVVEVAGVIERHARYGNQFKVEAVICHLPGSARGVAQWCAERLPNVGPERGHALLVHFGDKLWDIIETDHQKLTVVKGINAERAQEIKHAYILVKAEREAVIDLLKLKIPMKYALDAIRRWGDRGASTRIRENPYLLYEELDMKFELVDKIALSKLEVKPTDRRRVSAVTVKELRESLSKGDCAMVRHTLVNAVATVLKLKHSEVEAQLGDFPLVSYGKVVMLKEIDDCEQLIANSVVMLRASDGADHGEQVP